VLTLFTTPVIFLGFERWAERRGGGSDPANPHGVENDGPTNGGPRGAAEPVPQ
jgi:hypothetical protein